MKFSIWLLNGTGAVLLFFLDSFGSTGLLFVHVFVCFTLLPEDEMVDIG